MKHEKKTASVTGRVFSAGLSFLFCLLLAFSLVAALLLGTVFNEGYMKWQLNSGHYYTYIKQNVDARLSSYGDAAGFDEDFCSSLLTEDRLRRDVGQQLTDLYQGNGRNVSGDDFEAYVYEKVKEQVAGEAVKDSALTYFAKVCADAYTDNVNLPLIRYVFSLLISLRRPLWMALGVAVLLTAVVGWLLRRIRPAHTGRYIAYALGGDVLLLTVPTCVLLFSGVVRRLGFGTKALYYTATAYLNHWLMLVLTVAAALLLLCVLLAWYACRTGKAVTVAAENAVPRESLPS